MSSVGTFDMGIITEKTGYKLSYNGMHVIIIGTLAAFVAPIGGFIASGFKRAYKVKDFGNLIPGHGGVMDRIDCIALMGLFLALYLT